MGPLVSDLAPEELRGRYMAASGFSWQLGFIAGPVLGGAVLAANRHALWPLAALVLLAAAVAALRLDATLPPGARRTPGRSPGAAS
jgi:MFS family permease